MEIKQRVNRLCRKYGTRDPFELAERMNILVVREPLGSINGYYNQCYRQKFIHINEELEEYRQLHPKANTPFLRDNTLFSVSRLEREANCFAAELLCPDEVLLEYPGCTVGELARILGIREEALWACKGLG